MFVYGVVCVKVGDATVSESFLVSSLMLSVLVEITVVVFLTSVNTSVDCIEIVCATH